MSTTAQTILDAALSLTDAERVELICRLAETLPTEDQEFWDKDFAAELDRRADEVERGIVKTIPWSELRDQE